MTLSHHNNPYLRNVVAVFGVPFDVLTLDGAADRIVDAARAGDRLFFSTVNLDWMVMAKENPAFYRTILRSDMVTCDGAPLLKLANLMGANLPQRVTGADLFEVLRARELSPTLKTCFFGGRDNAAESAVAALETNSTGLSPVGGINPGFGTLDDLSSPEWIERVNATNPDLLIVALGAAKGQMWIDRNFERLNARVVAHLGAVVDFAGGGIKRAPEIAQSLHLEWAWRIGQDPQLWRRYAKDAGLLPQLLNKALKVKRLIQAQPIGDECSVTEADQTVHLEGNVEDFGLIQLADILWAAEGANRAFNVRISPDARIGLKIVGQLLIARQRFSDRGLHMHIQANASVHEALLHINHLPLSSGSNRGEGAKGSPPSERKTVSA